jgi:TonB-dependent SusC/RagA subfamily outer membrane receptor
VRVPTELTQQQAIGAISGRVIAAQSGQPVSAAQVYISGLDIGVLTQQNGRYLLQNVPAGPQSVTVERIGYRLVTRQVTVASGATATVDFQLDDEALQLDAIVVTGTPGGSQVRAIGNVVGRVDVGTREQVSPSVNFEQILGERQPGLMISSPGGSVGGDGGFIRIRGSSSPGLSNEPIIYVDGVRINSERRYVGEDRATSRLNDINPADIESIEIIKGPAASTIYGTEAKNGVIQIITKRGSVGAPAFDASVEVGSSWLAKPAEKVGERWGISPTTGELLQFNLVDAEEERFGKPLFHYGPLQRLNLSVRGGTDQIQYFGSFGHQYREGIVSWNWERSTSGRLNLGLTPRENLKIDFGLSIMGGSTRDDGSIFSNVYASSPLSAADYGGRTDVRRGFQTRPPEGIRDGRDDIRDVGRYVGTFTANFAPWPWFQHRLTAGIDITNEKRTVFTPKDEVNQWFAVASRQGQKSLDLRETRLSTLDYAATVSARLLEDNLGSASSMGLQYSRRWWQELNSTGINFAAPSLSTVGAASQTTGGESVLENTTVGVYGQQQLDWDQRIFLTGALRFDDNSAFGANFDAAVYPKLSATWVVHEESFWNVSQVNQLRLRAAWGAAGIQPDVFAATRLYQVQAGPGSVPIVTPSVIGNPDIGPEKSQELEAGFDVAFFDDRVTLGFTRYWKTTKDAIVNRPTAESLGFPSDQLANIGEVKNWGNELELHVTAMQRDPIVWELDASFATMGNEITDIGGAGRIPIGRGNAHEEGFSLGILSSKAVVSADLVSPGVVANVLCDGGTGRRGLERGGPAVPCDSAPFLYFGESQPTWHSSLGSTWRLFSNWMLYAQVDARGGHYQTQDGIAANHTTYASTPCATLLDDPICLSQRTVDRTALGVYDASFARLRELSVSYAFPSSLTERLRVSSASINVGWRNVALLWFPGKWVGKEVGLNGIKDLVRTTDPESHRVDSGFTGVTARSTPPLSQASVTLSVSF